MYRITYEQGNGYHCGCCRSTWTETSDCDTKEEVIEWLSELEADKKISSYEDAYDREVIEIREIKDENLTSQFQADPKLVEKIVERTTKDKERRKKAKEFQDKVNKEEREKKKLKELANKYPEELKENE